MIQSHNIQSDSPPEPDTIMGPTSAKSTATAARMMPVDGHFKPGQEDKERGKLKTTNIPEDQDNDSLSLSEIFHSTSNSNSNSHRSNDYSGSCSRDAEEYQQPIVVDDDSETTTQDLEKTTHQSRRSTSKTRPRQHVSQPQQQQEQQQGSNHQRRKSLQTGPGSVDVVATGIQTASPTASSSRHRRRLVLKTGAAATSATASITTNNTRTRTLRRKSTHGTTTETAASTTATEATKRRTSRTRTRNSSHRRQRARSVGSCAGLIKESTTTNNRNNNNKIKKKNPKDRLHNSDHKLTSLELVGAGNSIPKSPAPRIILTRKSTTTISSSTTGVSPSSPPLIVPSSPTSPPKCRSNSGIASSHHNRMSSGSFSQKLFLARLPFDDTPGTAAPATTTTKDGDWTYSVPPSPTKSRTTRGISTSTLLNLSAPCILSVPPQGKSSTDDEDRRTAAATTTTVRSTEKRSFKTTPMDGPSQSSKSTTSSSSLSSSRHGRKNKATKTKTETSSSENVQTTLLKLSAPCLLPGFTNDKEEHDDRVPTRTGGDRHLSTGLSLTTSRCTSTKSHHDRPILSCTDISMGSIAAKNANDRMVDPMVKFHKSAPCILENEAEDDGSNWLSTTSPRIAASKVKTSPTIATKNTTSDWRKMEDKNHDVTLEPGVRGAMSTTSSSSSTSSLSQHARHPKRHSCSLLLLQTTTPSFPEPPPTSSQLEFHDLNPFREEEEEEEDKEGHRTRNSITINHHDIKKDSSSTMVAVSERTSSLASIQTDTTSSLNTTIHDIPMDWTEPSPFPVFGQMTSSLSCNSFLEYQSQNSHLGYNEKVSTRSTSPLRAPNGETSTTGSSSLDAMMNTTSLAVMNVDDDEDNKWSSLPKRKSQTEIKPLPKKLPIAHNYPITTLRTVTDDVTLLPNSSNSSNSNNKQDETCRSSSNNNCSLGNFFALEQGHGRTTSFITPNGSNCDILLNNEEDTCFENNTISSTSLACMPLLKISSSSSMIKDTHVVGSGAISTLMTPKKRTKAKKKKKKNNNNSNNIKISSSSKGAGGTPMVWKKVGL